MSDPVRSEVLKSNPKRSVYLESGGGREPRIVKRFHGPDLLDRFRDRLRARNEFSLLAELRRLDLPVPAPLELRKSKAGWEVVLSFVENARPLDEWLRRSDRSREASGSLARDLGRLVARLFALGLDHRDLHPGNILVQEPDTSSPCLWLIDLTKSRLRNSLTADGILNDLIQLGAGTRETSTDAERRRFLVALYAQLPGGLAGLLPGIKELGRAIEDGARTFRARDIARRTRRWLRDSSSVEPYDDERGRGYLRRDLDRDLPLTIARSHLPSDGSDAHLELDGRTILVQHSGTARDRRRAWVHQVRLFTHGLTALEPLCLSEAPSGWFAFGASGHWTPIGTGPARSEVRAALTRSLGTLAGSLHDRLLDLPSWDPRGFWSDGNGELRFGPQAAFVEPSREDTTPRLDLEAPRRAFEAWTGPWSEDETEAYRSAYASALRHSDRERREIRKRART